MPFQPGLGGTFEKDLAHCVSGRAPDARSTTPPRLTFLNSGAGGNFRTAPARF